MLKKILTLNFAILITASLFAQQPQGAGAAAQPQGADGAAQPQAVSDVSKKIGDVDKAVGDFGKNFLAALEKGRTGERYILGGEDLTLKQILDKLADITGLRSPVVKLPYVFAFAAGLVDEAITGRLLHREPRATIDTVRMGKKKMFASSAKAERELGWKIVPVDGALRHAVQWFQTNGYV